MILYKLFRLFLSTSLLQINQYINGSGPNTHSAMFGYWLTTEADYGQPLLFRKTQKRKLTANSQQSIANSLLQIYENLHWVVVGVHMHTAVLSR